MLPALLPTVPFCLGRFGVIRGPLPVPSPPHFLSPSTVGACLGQPCPPPAPQVLGPPLLGQPRLRGLRGPCPKQAEDDDENARPLAESLLLAIADLLFCPDFTVQSHRRSTVVRARRHPPAPAQEGSGPRLGSVEVASGRDCPGRARLPGTRGPRRGWRLARLAGSQLVRARPSVSGRQGTSTHCLGLGRGGGGAGTLQAWPLTSCGRWMDLEGCPPRTPTHHWGPPTSSAHSLSLPVSHWTEQTPD